MKVHIDLAYEDEEELQHHEFSMEIPEESVLDFRDLLQLLQGDWDDFDIDEITHAHPEPLPPVVHTQLS